MKWIIVDLQNTTSKQSATSAGSSGCETVSIISRLTINVDDIHHVRLEHRQSGDCSHEITVISDGKTEICCKNSFKSVIWAIQHVHAQTSQCILDIADKWPEPLK